MRVHYISISILTEVVLKTLQLLNNLIGIKICIDWLSKMWNVTTSFALANFDINWHTLFNLSGIHTYL